MSGMRCACGRFKSKSAEQCASCLQANVAPDALDVGIAVVSILTGSSDDLAVRAPFQFCGFKHGCSCKGECVVYAHLRPRHRVWKAMSA